MKTIYLVVAGIVLGGMVYYYTLPKTYEDCVLANIEKAENEQSARTINAMCRHKFPEPPNPFDQFDPISKN